MDEQQLIAAIQSALSDIESGLRKLKDLSIDNAETAAYFALCYAEIASMRGLVGIVQRIAKKPEPQPLLPNESLGDQEPPFVPPAKPEQKPEEA